VLQYYCTGQRRREYGYDEREMRGRWKKSKETRNENKRTAGK
jgi:hypothetical protein